MKTSLISAALHVAIVGVVVLLTPKVGHTRGREKPPSTILVYQPPLVPIHHETVRWPQPHCQCVSTYEDVAGLPKIPSFDVPTTLPPIGVASSIVETWEGPVRPSGGDGTSAPTGVLSADVVDVQVSPYPGGPTPRYPEALRAAGIEGEVTLEFVVDTTGRVENGSVRVLSTPSDAFVVSIRDALAATRYHPALVAGRRVRQLVRQGFVFALTQR